MRPAMEARIRTLGLEERVRLLGSVADPTAMLGAFDVVVQASRSEGLPNALLEAAAAGRPIVATAAGGSGEIVLDGQTGLLVPIDDGDALASALLRLLGDTGLRESLGPAARERVATTFGMGRFVAEFAALYQGLPERGASHRGLGSAGRIDTADGFLGARPATARHQPGRSHPAASADHEAGEHEDRRAAGVQRAWVRRLRLGRVGDRDQRTRRERLDLPVTISPSTCSKRSTGPRRPAW